MNVLRVLCSLRKRVDIPTRSCRSDKDFTSAIAATLLRPTLGQRKIASFSLSNPEPPCAPRHRARLTKIKATQLPATWPFLVARLPGWLRRCRGPAPTIPGSVPIRVCGITFHATVTRHRGAAGCRPRLCDFLPRAPRGRWRTKLIGTLAYEPCRAVPTARAAREPTSHPWVDRAARCPGLPARQLGTDAALAQLGENLLAQLGLGLAAHAAAPWADLASICRRTSR